MGKLAEIKTKPTEQKVDDFLANVADEQKRKDSSVIIEMMERLSKEKPQIWGSSIVGFGNLRYKSPNTGREVDWFKIGFSPRKANLTLYLVNFHQQAELLAKLGKYKTGGGCLYINKLADVDTRVLEKLISAVLKYNSKNS